MVNEKGTFYWNEVTFKTSEYPSKNICKLDDQVFVINGQPLIPSFIFDNKNKSFLGYR